MIDIADKHALDQLLARYGWLFDHGDSDGYAALFVEDGVLTGFGAPMQGRAALAGLVDATMADSGGKWRHHLTNIVYSYLEGSDRVEAKAYQLITNWRQVPPALHLMVEARWILVRAADDWKIASLDLQFVGPDA